MEEDRMSKRIFTHKKWRGQDEGENPEKDGEKKKKEIFK
jgi:hypothetical protein